MSVLVRIDSEDESTKMSNFNDFWRCLNRAWSWGKLKNNCLQYGRLGHKHPDGKCHPQVPPWSNLIPRKPFEDYFLLKADIYTIYDWQCSNIYCIYFFKNVRKEHQQLTICNLCQLRFFISFDSFKTKCHSCFFLKRGFVRFHDCFIAGRVCLKISERTNRSL